MKEKKTLLFPLLALLFSCAGARTVDIPVVPPEAENIFLNPSVSGSDLFFFGAAGVQSSRDKTVRLALEAAARRAAMFHRVEASFHSKTDIGAGFFDYSSATETSLLFDERYAELVENLLFDPETDIIQNSNTVFVRVRYPAASLELEYFPAGNGSRPSWIVNPPGMIAAYPAGVGYAGRRASHSDTIRCSYENAVFALITNMSSGASGLFQERQGGAFSVSFTTSELGAHGVLSGFYVLETWVDPVSRAVWTLAIAQNNALTENAAHE